MFLEGRPPVNLGVTSGGDLFGGTQVTFSDVLGDKQFNMFAASVQQYRTLSFSYVNLSRRLQYALQAFSQTQFYYGYQPGVLFDYDYARLDRDQAIATQTARGATAFAIYPFNRYARRTDGRHAAVRQEYNDRISRTSRMISSSGMDGRCLERVLHAARLATFRDDRFPRGSTRGQHGARRDEFAPKVGDFLSRHTADVDARYYMRTLPMVCWRSGRADSRAGNSRLSYFGGNSELRGYEYLEFLGNKGFFANAELRFPLIEAALTPIGVVGGLRGIAFVNLGASGYDGVPMKVWSSKAIQYQPLLGFTQDPVNPLLTEPVFGPVQSIEGFKLMDGRASYGVGLETFALGFPIHFDWSWRTLFNKEWEDLVFAYQGGSTWFRKPRFAMWIGYDF
jgi:outer membrane protein assembly factor BamA